ncbi:MAG TPA: hypothetical protein VF691_07630, partial [Cytophagaceae bacterium]
SPEGRQQVGKWVADKNKRELLKWLKSANTEKQIYAVDGLYQLEKVGLKLSEEEKKILAFVVNKSGTMNVCFGCMHTKEEIVSVTRKFKH